MLAKVFLFFGIIIITGILTVLSLIMGIIKFSVSDKVWIRWLAAFIGSLIVMLICIMLLTRSIIDKTKSFAKDMEKISMEQAKAFESLGNDLVHTTDSIGLSAQIPVLKSMEPLKHKDLVPESFYTYLGFRDYYRLPLRYPYSLHCMDSLYAAELFNEEDVIRFDVNDNGERSCDLASIRSFAFTKDHFIAETAVFSNGKTKKEIVYYNFNTGEKRSFRDQNGLEKFLKEQDIDLELEWISPADYYHKF